MYRIAGKKIIISEAGRSFKADMKTALSSANYTRVNGPVSLGLIFYFKDNRRRDLDNYMKPTIDSLKGLMFGDDSSISRIYAEKIQPSEYEGIYAECFKHCSR